MQVEFPSLPGCSGVFLVSPRRHPSTASAQRLGVFVLKREYRWTGSALAPAAIPEGIRQLDETLDAEVDGQIYKFTLRENDLAPWKPRADLIVMGNFAEQDECHAWVTPAGGSEQLWLHRDGAILTIVENGVEISDRDSATHMFGWEQRGFVADEEDPALPPERAARRRLLPDFAVDPPPPAPVADNHFFNAYKRAFSAAGFPAAEFTAGSGIRLRRAPQAGAATERSFTLGGENIAAEVFTYRGRGPDQRHLWACQPMEEIRLDTVVVQPDADRVAVLWRGIWLFDAFAANAYRLLQVTLSE